MIHEISLETNLEQVTINATFYQQARDLHAILMVDSKTPEDKQVHMLASMFQSAYDQGALKGWNELKQTIMENLFRR